MTDDTTFPPENNFPAGYQPAKVWEWKQGNGGRFANINRPISGATHDKELPVGKHPLQLYSLATPNGVKVTVMLEELLAAGHGRRVRRLADQYRRGQPVRLRLCRRQSELEDPGNDGPFSDTGADAAVRKRLDPALSRREVRRLPADRSPQAHRTMNWLFWQMGSGPYLGGGFGHFYAYAPMKIQYAIDRFAMEVKRQLDVLDKHLANNEFMAGAEYTIADMAIWPWYGTLVQGGLQ
jgi:GST-like protein